MSVPCAIDIPEVDILSVGDTSLNTTRPIGSSPQFPILTLNEGVIVGGTRESGSSEPGSDLETFGRWDGEHGVGEDCFEFIETWFSET